MKDQEENVTRIEVDEIPENATTEMTQTSKEFCKYMAKIISEDKENRGLFFIATDNGRVTCGFIGREETISRALYGAMTEQEGIAEIVTNILKSIKKRLEMGKMFRDFKKYMENEGNEDEE